VALYMYGEILFHVEADSRDWVVLYSILLTMKSCLGSCYVAVTCVIAQQFSFRCIYLLLRNAKNTCTCTSLRQNLFCFLLIAEQICIYRILVLSCQYTCWTFKKEKILLFLFCCWCSCITSILFGIFKENILIYHYLGFF